MSQVTASAIKIHVTPGKGQDEEGFLSLLLHLRLKT